MSKDFIVDFRIAARDNLFSASGWRWPVPQSNYDIPLNNFLEKYHNFPYKLSHNTELRTAYELVEAELLKELMSIGSTWIDVAAAKKNNLTIIFSPDQKLHQMFHEDRFIDYSTRADLYHKKFGSLRAKLREKIRQAKNWTNINLVDNQNISIGANTLTNEIRPESTSKIQISPYELNLMRPPSQSTIPATKDTAIQITSDLDSALERVEAKLSSNGKKFVAALIEKHISNGIIDQQIKLPLGNVGSRTKLYCGTGGNYRSRLAAHLVQREGGQVIRTTHGGDTALFNDPLWPNVELPFASKYVTYGNQAAKAIKAVQYSHPRSKVIGQDLKIQACGSKYYESLITPAQNKISIPYDGQVAVIAAAFLGENRIVPNYQTHDVIYLDWHSRLLGLVRSLGYKTISKRHPKGIGTKQSLFYSHCDSELTEEGMSDLEDIDGYVLDFVGTAFMEAMCTLKPVILIDFQVRQFTKEGKLKLLKSTQIVKANFDEDNRLQIDPSELRHALNAEVDVEERKKFLEN